MTQGEFMPIWEKVKALWPGWATSIQGPHEAFNLDAVFKMFRFMPVAPVEAAVDQHFAESSGKKRSFEPPFGEILKTAKSLNWAEQQADPMREIHQTFVSMLPRVRQLELETEWHRRMADDRENDTSVRNHHAAIAALGEARLMRYGPGITDYERQTWDRAIRWRQEAVAALAGQRPDDLVRESTRPIPTILSKPSPERTRAPQTIGQVWK